MSEWLGAALLLVVLAGAPTVLLVLIVRREGRL